MSSYGAEMELIRDAGLSGLKLNEDDGNALPPVEPSLSPPEWIKKNLFSTPFNGVLTIIFGLFAFWAFRSLLGFTFAPERVWRAPATNARLLLAGIYPDSQFHRVWVSLGIVLGLTGLSMGIMRAGGPISMKRLAIWIMTTGAFLVAAVLFTPHIVLDAEGIRLQNESSNFIFGFLASLGDSIGQAFTSRIVWLLLAAAVLAVGAAIWFGLGDKGRRSKFIHSTALIYGVLAAIALALWVVPFGDYRLLKDGTYLNEPNSTVAFSTQLPFTLCMLVLFGAWIIGRFLGPRLPYRPVRGALGLAWVLLPFFCIFVILRDPGFDMGYVATVNVPIFLAFAIGGSIILWLLSRPGLGELGRIIAVGLVGVAVFTWVAAFFGWYPGTGNPLRYIAFWGWSPTGALQIVRLSFLALGLVALGAHTFSTDRSTRLKFVGFWVGLMAVMHYFATVINSERTLDLNQEIFIEGLILTLVVASLSVLLSFPFGLILALGRTSSMPIFRQLSTLYIEFVRGVPLVTVLFLGDNILPLFLPNGMDVGDIAAATAGFAAFSAAYLAENVRGGLQAIRRGQFEAADALGLTTPMRTSFIIIPQALRASIPQLVGQAIASFKETSLILIIGSLDLLLIARNAIPQQTEFFGVKREGLLVVVVIYFIGSFAMSKYSQKLERRLGVGER